MRRQIDPNSTTDHPFSVLIVCDHASAKFGGEAILPLHYFRLLRDRGVAVWLVSHARTRAELSELFPGERRIRYVEDSALHRLLWRLGTSLPTQLAYVTTGFLSRLVVQASQRRIVRDLVASERIDLVHQPIPVSPREPSIIFDVGAPVIIGPMNGGMDYPPAFRRHQSRLGRTLFRIGRSSAALLNRLMPGKRRAALLLVANERTRAALPNGVCERVAAVGENGVELDLWTRGRTDAMREGATAVRFAFVGRLVALKAVDMLLEAFAIASMQAPMQLVIVGDGKERQRLEARAAALFPARPDGIVTAVRFTGWVTQTDCAAVLADVDCLVMPSLRDCGGAVVLEAMSMSMPVIATAWGGPLDYLDDSCGILIDPTGRQALIDGMATAMVRIATSPVERAAMGIAARRKVESCYDWDVKAEEILAVYRQVLGTSVQPAETEPVAA